MKAVWNNQVVAESKKTIILEGNHYFPEESLKSEFFEKSEYKTVCPFKGSASYFNINVDGKLNKDAAWSYLTPKVGHENIKNHFAFWKGVQVIED